MGLPAIVNDIPCQRCAYNLRGLSAEGTCPECGAPVLVALYGDRLELADPQWLAKVSRGCNLCRGAGAIMFLTSGLGSFAQWPISMLPQSVSTLLFIVGALLLLILAVVVLRGLWLIGTPHERLRLDEAADRQRQCFRFGILTTPLTIGIAVPFAINREPEILGLIVLIGAPLGVVGTIGAWGFGCYMEYLANRLQDLFSEGRARIYRKWYIGCWLLFAGGMAPLMFSASPGFYCAVLPGGLGVLGFGILLLGLIEYLAKELQESAKLAEGNWRIAGDK